MICFGIFFKKSVIGLFELFCPRALRKGPVYWRLENIFEQNIPCGPFCCGLGICIQSWWKKCKTRKSGQKTQTHQNICRQSISFCCFHCWYLYYRGIQSLHLLWWVLCSTTNDSMEKQSSKGKLCSIHPHQLTANCAISLLRFFNSLIACSQLLSYIPHLPHGGAVSGSAFPCWMHTRPVHQCKTDSNTNIPERGTSYWPSQSGLPDVWLLRGDPPGTIKIHWQSGDMVDRGRSTVELCTHCRG